MKDYITAESLIATEKLNLARQGVPFYWGQFGAKYYAEIRLTNGKRLYCCLHRKTVRYGINKAVKYKNILNFCKANNLEIKK